MLGALLCERAGVLNLGIEGILTLGAMAGWLAVYLGRRPLDRRAGRGPGRRGRSGLLHALLTVPLGLSQHVAGIGITLLATSLSYLRLPDGAAGGRHAAAHRAVPALGHPGAVGPALLGPALFSRRR